MNVDIPDIPALPLPSRKSIKKKLLENSDFLTRSDWFKNQVERAFMRCDVDANGQIDETEFWAGILVLYHILNKIPFGGHISPPSQKHVFKIFHFFDVDRSGYLDKSEFLAVSRHLCADVAFDIVKRILVSIVVVPALVHLILHVLSNVDNLEYLVEHQNSIMVSLMTAVIYLLIPSLW
eukprot:CAMPEP_0184019682 /NCGR_PEP_ID=MMETSP0954-20121128/8896_1 /TAXON_ID=627963 /ORGANISM="Aplanochytrium sp, Strain PBS07" /LENGTH=178 /DNA_ID=CAMNT_0026301393 /DNA_START=303 /DNA_END=836 /DNA_ORIENTATION=-